MSDHEAYDRAGDFKYPVVEDTLPARHQFAEGVMTFDFRPASAEEVAMCVQIDEIHNQLARDIPKLQHEMDELLLRVRRPGLIQVALATLGQLFKCARDTQDLYRLHETVKATIMALDSRLRAVEDRLIQLEAGQGQIVSEAKSTATGVATMIASAVIADAVIRVTRIEEGLGRLSGRSGGLAVPGDAARHASASMGDFGIAG